MLLIFLSLAIEEGRLPVTIVWARLLGNKEIKEDKQEEDEGVKEEEERG